MFDFEFKAQSRADELAELDLDGRTLRLAELTDEQRDSLLLAARRDAALTVIYAKSSRNMLTFMAALLVISIVLGAFGFGPFA
ncbi:MAG: hypothetical protein HOY44_10095 [Maritimibacter sp.]|uniref:hypothetical protein n=1 Tax=Maritimibacter sp. TaxID=2003363 RepID=UPI001DB28191|nr:hypothetical protein [Maritimibacter sp.]MBL6427864.1 hypothetical protein [Maritimibacter sp.]